jgi:protein O-GlcNAc transferase
MTNIRRKADVRWNMKVAQSWSNQIARHATAIAPQQLYNHLRKAAQRIRIGYLSNDFRDHAVAHQIRGMFEKHDRQQFEIYGYATNPDDGTAYRKLLSKACDHFREIHNLSDLAAAKQIHEDGIHILVDMSGHSRNNRLGIAALRPAPIQASYLGFLSTTGANFIDYVFADAIVLPKAHAAFYSEKIVYLPHSYQANDDMIPIARRKYERSQFDLPEKGFVYCSFNQPYKIDERTFGLWLNILQRVDGSVLWLVERSPLARRNLCRAAELAHVDSNRLVFTGFMHLEDNLARLKLADLVLDTRIYNGGATTSNALWAGVPVLTLPGNHWVSRMSTSALMAMGLPELIAKDMEDYRRIAIELALAPDKLKAMRQRVGQRRATAPLFDTRLFTRHIEKAYNHMWYRYLDGLKPASFKVEPWKLS